MYVLHSCADITRNDTVEHPLEDDFDQMDIILAVKCNESPYKKQYCQYC